VQHDGDGWRCLVARSSAVISSGDFAADRLPRFAGRAEPRPSFLQFINPDICSPAGCIACMNQTQERRGSLAIP
jgi:hypothetical protein